MNEFTKSLIKDILTAAVIAGILLFFIRPTIVKQNSMQNTMQPNDYLIMYKQAYRSSNPHRGDIVIFQSSLRDENGNDKLLIKRVIGIPGDTITIKGDQLYLNGKAYQEDYLKDGITTGDISNYEVPHGEYFVMGDNRVVSKDSRSEDVGCVNKEQIRGKVVLRLFPFNKIRTF